MRAKEIPTRLKAGRFILVRVLVPVLAVGFASAQFAGPTDPKTTAFEPVDTTDLVNLATGDFSYSLPILAVPGAPGGAYPIGLGYHAGILYDQEASWVGLGWNLSVGSVNRAVRDLPDDYFGVPLRTYQDLGRYWTKSLGFSYSGVNIGVQYDSHGGFGGSVGYHLSRENASYGVNVSYYRSGGGSTSWGAGLSYGFAYQGQQFATGISLGSGGVDISGQFGGWGPGSLSFSSKSGLSYHVSPRNSVNGISLSSNGTLSIGGITRRPFRANPYGSSPNLVSAGGGKYLNLYVFNYLEQHYRIIREEYSGAFGYLNMDKVAQSELAQDFLNSDAADDGIQFEELDMPLSRYVQGFVDDEHYPRFDFFTQDYQRHVNAFDEDYPDRASFQADYAAPSFDFFHVAAQGISGNARPILAKRGFLRPSDSVMTHHKEFGDGSIFRPYRSFLDLVRRGDNPFEPYREYLYPDAADYGTQYGQWAAFPAAADPNQPDNMIFLGDAGHVEDTRWFRDGLFQDHYSPRLENRANRIRYVTDADHRIVKIIVVKADGLRYFFGLHKPGDVTYGAAPNTSEDRYAKTAKRLGEASFDDQWSHTFLPEYAYAWHLAAIESPDYVDRGEPGYDDADWGDFMAVRYGMVAAHYVFSTPFEPYAHPATGGPDNWIYTGYDLKTNRHNFEHVRGDKEIYAPLFIETKTHVASFTYAGRSDGLSADWELDPTGLTDGAYYKHGDFFWGSYLLEDGGLGQLATALNVHPKDVFFFPIGTAEKYGADEIPVHLRYRCDGLSVLPDPGSPSPVDPDPDDPDVGILPHVPMTYRGTVIQEGVEYEIFTLGLATDHPFHQCGSLVYQAWIPPYTAYSKLEHVQLFERDRLPSYDTPQTLAGLKLYDHHPDRFAGNQDYLTQVRFGYSHRLGKGMPNNDTDGNEGGRLTLEEVTYYGRGHIRANAYSFDYYDPPGIAYHANNPFKRDPWGYYSAESIETERRIDPSRVMDDGVSIPVQAAWSLKSVTTPVGTRIDVFYESDAFSYVQDRLAVKHRGTFWGGVGGPNGPFLSLSELAIDQLLRNGASLNTEADIKAALLAETFALPGPGSSPDYEAFWPEHVVVTGEYVAIDNQPSFQETATKRFILPIEPRGGGHGFSDHAALDELVSWLLLEDELDLDDGHGNVSLLEVRGIPAEFVTDAAGETRLSPLSEVGPYQLDPPVSWGITGEVGGGLRVEKLEMVGAGESYQVLYDYRFPGMNIDSGVVFVDPGRYLNEGRALKYSNAIVPAEQKPYHNMPGTEVTYAHVRMRTIGNGQESLEHVHYEFFTPKDPAIANPFGSGMELVHADPVFQPLDYQGSDTFKLYRYDGERNWSTIDAQARFSIKADVRKSLLDNSALIGRLKKTTYLDDDDRPMRESETMYEANYPFEAGGELPLLKRFRVTGDNPGRLEEVPATEFLARTHQGVRVDKTLAILAGWEDDGETTTAGEPFLSRYDFKFLSIDEIHNQFRVSGANTREYHYPGPQTREPNRVLVTDRENLAFDYFTGAPVISRASTANRAGILQWLYQLQVSAHQIYGEGAMTALHSLTQPGYSLSALFEEGSAGEPDPEQFLDSLESGSASVLSAESAHWRKPFPDRAAWLTDATYRFVQNEAKTANQWRSIYLNPTQTGSLLKLKVPAQPGDQEGFWLAQGQNTRFDLDLNPLEYRDYRDQFSAVRYIHDGRSMAALFHNAQTQQVFYEGFEEQTQDVYRNDGFLDGTLAANYLDNFDKVYLGTRSHTGSFATGLNLGNAYGTAVSDPRSDYWISFYVNGTGSVTVNGTLVETLDQDRCTDELLVQGVEPGWVLIRVQAQGTPGSLAIEIPASAYLDEIAVYPAAQDQPGEPGHRSDASVELFGYHPHLGKLISKTDVRGRTIRFEYDRKGHLFRTYDGDGRLKSEHYRSLHGEPLHGNAVGLPQ